jgi:hypothetical protein
LLSQRLSIFSSEKQASLADAPVQTCSVAKKNAGTEAGATSRERTFVALERRRAGLDAGVISLMMDTAG